MKESQELFGFMNENPEENSKSMKNSIENPESKESYEEDYRAGEGLTEDLLKILSPEVFEETFKELSDISKVEINNDNLDKFYSALDNGIDFFNQGFSENFDTEKKSALLELLKENAKRTIDFVKDMNSEADLDISKFIIKKYSHLLENDL